MRRHLSAVAVAAVTALTGTSCGEGPTTPVIPGSSFTIGTPGKAVVYAAVGASETVGTGADIDRIRNAWPSAFFTTALPRAAVDYNFGIGGETVSAALRDELPGALAVRPTVVTVWLNVDDLLALVPAAQYQRNLATMVEALRQGGRAKVLVANLPVIDHLPLINACLGGTPVPLEATCPTGFAGAGHSRADLERQEAAYNDAVSTVVHDSGAILVDLHAQGDVATLHPGFVDREDGFHPSDQGHRAIAAVFAAALVQAGGP